MQNVFTDFVKAAKVARVRTMREFAEQEIIIPDGDFEGLRFKIGRQPFTGLWLEACDNPHWNTFVGLGPTQSGKSLLCLVIPVLYHLFEMRETVVIGIPRMEIAEEKWFKDFLPVIRRSRYDQFLPQKGPGSRGGIAETMQFGHGPILKFMTGGGGDKVRASFTSRVVAVTEVDGFRTSMKSVEADPIRQLIARTRHYAERRRIYLECTVTNPTGRIWTEWDRGSAGQIILTCPHCTKSIIPLDAEAAEHGEIKDRWRESLRGWQTATNEIEAERESFFYCPECSHAWSEDDRKAANLSSIILHRGQSSPCDPFPPIRTFAMRWTAINSFFTSPSFLGTEEWKAANHPDTDSAQLEMSQYVWAIPIDPRLEAGVQLSTDAVMKRLDVSILKSKVPEKNIGIGVGVDLGLRWGHYVAAAAIKCESPELSSVKGEVDESLTYYYAAVFDYGVVEIPSDNVGVETAMPGALRDLRDELNGIYGEDLDQIWIDARYFPEFVYEVSRDESDDLPKLRPCFGYGKDQEGQGSYRSPKKNSRGVLYVGDHYHIEDIETAEVERVEIDSPFWKSNVHTGFLTPKRQPGAISIFGASSEGISIPYREHQSYAKHITAERMEKIFELGRGVVPKWTVLRRRNHFLDATYLALGALDFTVNASIRDHRKTLTEDVSSRLQVRKLSMLPLTTSKT